jgi:hypothetical protein
MEIVLLHNRLALGEDEVILEMDWSWRVRAYFSSIANFLRMLLCFLLPSPCLRILQI